MVTRPRAHGGQWRIPSCKRLTTVVAAIAMMTVAGATVAEAHPLHTTLTQVSIDPRDGSAQIVVRAFIDDFGAAAVRLSGMAAPADHKVSDDALRAYVMAKLTLVDARNQRLPLAWSGSRRQGDVVWLTLRAPTMKSLHGVRLATSILVERFEDQVNIVEVSDGGARRSMLFTRSDGERGKVLL